MKAEISPGHQSNNFDFLRIVAALMVLVSHQSPLTGRTEWVVTSYQSLGGIGLLIFFTMSGYLVSESWQRDPNILRFAIRRMLRVWPGLAVVVLLTAYVMGPMMTNMPIESYFSDPLTIHYLENLRFVHTDRLPGIFHENPLQFVNGSLWTLPIEVRWYYILALLGILRFIRWRFLLLIGTIILAAHYFFIFDVERVLSKGGEHGWKEELGLFFLAGACLQRFRREWEAHRLATWLTVAVLIVVFTVSGKGHAGFWLGISFLTINVALASWSGINKVARYGDFSYGIYIYAFPVQQTIIALTENKLSFATSLLISMVTTLMLAILSWCCIEAPALRLKPSRTAFSNTWQRLRTVVSATPR